MTLATHATGDWAIIFLMLSLAMTPARALFDWMPLIHVRRRIGVAAALYAGAHFLIYVLDQKWNLLVVATEILRRLQKVKEEVWSFREYYYIVRNDNLLQSLRELESIFLAERLKTKRLDMQWLEQNFILEKNTKPTTDNQ